MNFVCEHASCCVCVLVQAQEVEIRSVSYAAQNLKDELVLVEFCHVSSARGEVLVLVVARASAPQPVEHGPGVAEPASRLHGWLFDTVFIRRGQAILALVANYIGDAREGHQVLHLGLLPARRACRVLVQEEARGFELQSVETNNTSLVRTSFMHDVCNSGLSILAKFSP